jgi:hypothetical protein
MADYDPNDNTTLGDILEQAVASLNARAGEISRGSVIAAPNVFSTAIDSAIRDLYLDSDELSNRLRHRAEMMRRRANEFDDIADDLSMTKYISVRGVLESFDEKLRSINTILDEHAHVEPKKVK